MAAFDLETRKTLTLGATVLGSSIAFIDATVVIVALPTIERELDIGLAGQQWIFLSYSLALASLYLVGGAIGDRYGRRSTFIGGVIGFAAASALAGAATSGAVLILARALQGVAGAFLTTNSLALLRAVYGQDAGRAIGLWTAATSVVTIGGPAAGGALVEWTSWRWIFFLNLPLAAVAIAMAQLGRCNEQAQLRQGRLDLPGAVLAATGFGMLTYGLVEGAERGFGELWWAFAAGAGALIAFVEVERRVPEPMLPFAIFRVRNFLVANLATFFIYASLYGNFVFFTLYLQFLGFSAFEAGLVNVPGGLVMVAFAARFGALADRHGPRLFLVLGPALMALSSLLFLGLEERDDLWTWGVAGIACSSFGVAALVAPITATALKSAPAQLAGIASGVNSTVSRLGSLLAIAVIGVLISVVFDSQVDAEDAVPLAEDQRGAELRNASTDAFRAAMLFSAGLAVVGAAVAGAGISNREARGELSEPAVAPAGS